MNDNAHPTGDSSSPPQQGTKDPATDDIHHVLQFCAFPLHVKVVQNEDQTAFIGNPHERIHTILGYIHAERLKCLTDGDKHVYIPLDVSRPVLFTPIDNSLDLFTINDVIKYRKSNKLPWLVVTKQFRYKNSTYNPGDILQVQKLSLTQKIIRFLTRKKLCDKVKVISHPSKQKTSLPSHIYGHFKRCQSPYSSCYRLLSNLVLSKEMPFLITIPCDVTDSSRDLTVEIEREKLIVLEKVSYSIIIIMDSNNNAFVQAIPSTVPIMVEVLQHTCDESHPRIDYDEYTDIFIANLPIIECCPVYLKELLPETRSISLRSSHFERPLSTNCCNGNHANTTRGSIPVRSNSAESTRTNDMKTTRVEDFCSYDVDEDVAPTLPYRCTSSIAKSKHGIFDRTNSCLSHTSFSAEGVDMKVQEGYLKAVTDIELPLYSLSNKQSALNNGRTSYPSRSVEIGKDGYVIVPAIETDCENDMLLNSITKKKNNRGFRARFDLLYEEKFGVPPISNSERSPLPPPPPPPSLSTQISKSCKERHMKPLPMPKPVVRSKTCSTKRSTNRTET